MSKSLKEYIERIPEKYRNNLTLLEKFKGSKTKVNFKFMCGCNTSQSLTEILKLKDFECRFGCGSSYYKDREKFKCKFCASEYLVLDNRKKCESKCNLYYANLIEDEDYVVCKICNVHAKRLAGHIKLVHNLSKKEYMENHGKIISNKSSKTHSEANKITGNWINRAKENGEDLTEYCEKMSKAVSAAIMANPEDRTRRAGVMTKVNQSDVMRQKSSDTAKITSARPDIIESRTKQLQVWRDGYPDDFYNKCTKPMLNSWQSKPEKKLFEFVLELKGFKFKRNKFIKAKIFTSKTQIDMMDVKKRIYIEFDGPTHFKPIFGEDVLKVVIIKDRQLEDLIIKKNWTLIRISDDQYVDKNKIEKSYFKPECIAQLLEILNNKIPGIYKIGKAYE